MHYNETKGNKSVSGPAAILLNFSYSAAFQQAPEGIFLTVNHLDRAGIAKQSMSVTMSFAEAKSLALRLLARAGETTK